jgi:hypothetical protein
MSSALMVRVCPEQARELILDWLIPMTENGTMDELMKEFVKELEPYASSVANRLLRDKFLAEDPDLLLDRLRPLLDDVHQTLVNHTLNPDAMAVASTEEREGLLRSLMGLADWIHVLDKRAAAAGHAESSDTE